MNLVSNAIRYTRQGGVLVGVRRESGGFRVEVVDTGVGIRAERQSEIFEEFRRLGTDADQKDRGFGLGLAIVERIARLLEHRLEVRSVPGRGSPLPCAGRCRAHADAGGVTVTGRGRPARHGRYCW